MTERCWLLAALILVLTQVVPANQKTPLEIDEQVTYYIAHGRAPSSVWRRAFEQSATPPGYFWLVNASGIVGAQLGVGSREFWLRFPSLASYLAAVWLAWRIARRDFGSSAASAAAVILALHAIGVEKMAFQARPYALGLALVLVALDRLLWLQSRCTYCDTDATLFWLALAALPWTHYLFAVFFLPALVQVVFATEFAAFRWRLLRGIGIAFLLCLPLVPGAWRVQTIGPALAWITEPPSWKPLDALIVPVAFIAALAASIALRLLPARVSISQPAPNRWTLVVLIGWIVIPFATLMGLALFENSLALAQLRYFLPTLGPIVLLISGIFAAASRAKLVVVAAFVYAVVAGHAASAWHHIRHPVWHDFEWKDAGESLKDRAAASDVVFVQPGLVEAVLTPVKYADVGFQEYATSRLSDFYAGRSFSRLVVSPNFPRGEDRYLAEYTRRVEEVRRTNGLVWFVVSADTDLGELAQTNFEQWIKAKGFTVEIVRPNPVARILRCSPSP